jgi:FdhD protein
VSATDATARTTRIVAWSDRTSRDEDDVVAREEPLEIQVQGASVAVLMRTPGDDLDLALGFLTTEGIVRRPEDVVSMRHCSSVKDEEAEENILRVVLRDGVDLPLALLRRNTYASSSCGVCGKATIEATIVEAPPIVASCTIPSDVLFALPPRLREGQETFDKTGGLHAAGLFDLEGTRLALAEDVGRHNAVDKVVGRALSSGIELGSTCLLVSGRVSFEIVQKALVARIPIVAGISAPTSLAVALGVRAGVTLAGFLRDRSVNLYAHPERVVVSIALGAG